MKPLHALILAALLISTSSAFARIGESREEIEKRYGHGNRFEIQRLPGAETMVYHLNNTEVEVIFYNDKSIWEIFHPTDPDNVRIWLKANSGDGKTWNYDGVNDRWERSGSPLLIGCYWPGHEDYFSIKDVKAIAEVQNNYANNNLKGF